MSKKPYTVADFLVLSGYFGADLGLRNILTLVCVEKFDSGCQMDLRKLVLALSNLNGWLQLVRGSRGRHQRSPTMHHWVLALLAPGVVADIGSKKCPEVNHCEACSFYGSSAPRV